MIVQTVPLRNPTVDQATEAMAQPMNTLTRPATSWTMVGMLSGTVCTVLTMGLCPLTYLLYFCGFAAFLVIPIGIVEAVVGLIALTNPGSVKGVISYVALAQIPCILLGDIISPIAGIVSYMMAKDPEVAGYIQGV